ncbi:unnamed protein product [Polarella glacialis]|uniref:J domain-containing protein n=1 Tax=Polarella glacialis TaxID=89957 RepID=A0A813HY29_POLGL|nr:unnamed protein product [Polarella glacialis]
MPPKLLLSEVSQRIAKAEAEIQALSTRCAELEGWKKAISAIFGTKENEADKTATSEVKREKADKTATREVKRETTAEVKKEKKHKKDKHHKDKKDKKRSRHRPSSDDVEAEAAERYQQKAEKAEKGKRTGSKDQQQQEGKRQRGPGRSSTQLLALPPAVVQPRQDSAVDVAPSQACSSGSTGGAGAGGSSSSRNVISSGSTSGKALGQATGNASCDAADRLPVCVPDPRAAGRCYEALKVPRSATPQEIQRAFRSLARVCHPDKGGDHMVFICLSQAVEVLQEPSERAAYDRMLSKVGSSDGLAEATAAHELEQSVADPEMLQDVFLAVASVEWAELFSVLSDDNLQALAAFLQEPRSSKHKQPTVAPPPVPAPPPKCSKGAPAGIPGRTAATGICRSGSRYFAKVCFSQIQIRSRNTQLEEAIDSRMALLQLKSGVSERTAQGASLDDALRAAVAEIRSLEQNTVFYLMFSFEFKLSNGKRLTTPVTIDVETMLSDRRLALSMKQQGASVEEFNAAHNSAILRSQLNRQDMSAQRQFFHEQLVKQSTEQAKERSSQSAGAVRTLRPLLKPKPRLALTDLTERPTAAPETEKNEAEAKPAPPKPKAKPKSEPPTAKPKAKEKVQKSSPGGEGDEAASDPSSDSSDSSDSSGSDADGMKAIFES